MEFIKFINNKGISKFEDIKSQLLLIPYFITIKEDNDYPNLYMLNYNKKKSDLTINWVRECRGLIVEKETNRIICYTFNKKSYIDIDDENMNNLEKFKINYAIDGTQIKLYYYNNKWNCATTRCIDANKSFFYGKKCFNELFKEASVNLNYNKLDTNYCYSFVLQHIENRIVIKYTKNDIIHVLTRDLSKDNYPLIDHNIGIDTPINIDIFNNKELKNELQKIKNYEGIVLMNGNTFYKFRFKHYERLKQLRKNTNNLFYEFIINKQNKTLDEFILYYPEFSKLFKEYEIRLQLIIKKLHNLYINININKVMHLNEVESYLKYHLYKIHGIYIMKRQIIKKEIIYEYLLNLNTNQICAIYNKFNYKAINENNQVNPIILK